MKILALSYLYPNSIYPHYGIFVHNRLKAISKFHEVKVINPIPWFPSCGQLARYKNYDRIPGCEILDGLEVFHPRFLVIPRYWKFLDALTYRVTVMPLVNKLQATYPFDLIDLHWTYPDLPTGVALKRKYGKKMLVTLRGKEAFHIGEGKIRERLIRDRLLHADAVISLSRELQEMAVQAGVDKKRCSVICNGVDTSVFYYINQDTCRKRLKIPDSERVILCVGSLNFRKGFDRIIKAAPSLLRINKNYKIYIIGSKGPDGDYRKELDQLIAELELRDKVSFQGTVDNKELVHWYNAADLFCLSSRGEGSPNVLAEALSCGCPAVATDVGAVKEILQDECHGILVPNSATGIQSGLRMAITKQWDRRKICGHMQGYNWDWCAHQVLSLYEKLTKERLE